MGRKWEQIDHDPASGRVIFKADEEVNRPGLYRGNDHVVEAVFEVRTAQGTVLWRTWESAKGEYWCGVFLWFVKGSNGTQVRLDCSDVEVDEIIDVPDTPHAVQVAPED